MFFSAEFGGKPVHLSTVLSDLQRIFTWANRDSAYTQSLEDRIASLEGRIKFLEDLLVTADAEQAR